MTQRIIDVSLAVLMTTAAFFLSWPFWRNFEYWAESRIAWWIYFVLGYVAAVYVFFIFIACLRTLFVHDALVKSGQYATSQTADTDEEGIQ